MESIESLKQEQKTLFSLKGYPILIRYLKWSILFLICSIYGMVIWNSTEVSLTFGIVVSILSSVLLLYFGWYALGGGGGDNDMAMGMMAMGAGIVISILTLSRILTPEFIQAYKLLQDNDKIDFFFYAFMFFLLIGGCHAFVTMSEYSTYLKQKIAKLEKIMQHLKRETHDEMLLKKDKFNPALMEYKVSDLLALEKTFGVEKGPSIITPFSNDSKAFKAFRYYLKVTRNGDEEIERLFSDEQSQLEERQEFFMKLWVNYIKTSDEVKKEWLSSSSILSQLNREGVLCDFLETEFFDYQKQINLIRRYLEYVEPQFNRNLSLSALVSNLKLDLD